MEHLSAAQRAKIRRLSTDGEAPEGEAAGEINVVPFLDILMNVLMFVLATITVTFTATIESKAAGRGPRTAKDDSLGLTVLVASEGFGVKARGGNVAPGCEATGQGLAVGKSPDGKDYDFAGLKKCVTHLKKEFVASNPDSDETSVTISANPNIPYQAVIGTMDAIRKGDDEKDLFPDVNFGLAR